MPCAAASSGASITSPAARRPGRRWLQAEWSLPRSVRIRGAEQTRCDPRRLRQAEPADRCSRQSREIGRTGEPAAWLMPRRSQHVLGGVWQAVQRAVQRATRLSSCRLGLNECIQHCVESSGQFARSPTSFAVRPPRARSSRECGACEPSEARRLSILVRASEARESAYDSLRWHIFLWKRPERSGVRPYRHGIALEAFRGASRQPTSCRRI